MLKIFSKYVIVKDTLNNIIKFITFIIIKNILNLF